MDLQSCLTKLMASIEGVEYTVVDLTTQGAPVSIAAVYIHPSSPAKSFQSAQCFEVENGIAHVLTPWGSVPPTHSISYTAF